MSNGYYKKSYRIKQDAIPVDNVKKFGYEPEDYEIREEWVEYTDEEIKRRTLQEAENGLDSTDYISAKTMDALLSCTNSTDILQVLADFKTEYGGVIEQRKEWRKTINELEG